MSDAGQRDTLEVLRACAAGLAGLESKDIKNRQLKEKVTPIMRVLTESIRVTRFR